jgi:Sec-independent protein translocase protein TatA
MLDSNTLVYVVGEVAIMLLLVCLFLFFHVGKLKKLIKKLEGKISELRTIVKTAKRETKAAKIELANQVAKEVPVKTFLEYLDEQIDDTRSHHQSLNPDQDIVLDITPESPIERQVASLRHAFLLAEKEARFAGEDNQSSWEVLQSKLAQIISFYEPEEVTQETANEVAEPEEDESQQEEIANYKKRIENLEKFKKLFFEMDSKCEAANKQAEEYREELMALGIQLGGGEHFKDLLDSYNQSFDDLTTIITDGSKDSEEIETSGNDQAAQAATITQTVEIQAEKSDTGKRIVANQEEIQHLKNMAVDQHKVIVELKRRLMGADSEEDKTRVIEELAEQLDKQERFMKEAETCTQLLEDELSRTFQENETLRKELDTAGNTEDKENLESMVNDLTTESRDMLNTIVTLEDENKGLKEQLEAGAGTGGAADEALKEKLTQAQQDLLNLQTQHIELEERYLEMKIK